MKIMEIKITIGLPDHIFKARGAQEMSDTTNTLEDLALEDQLRDLVREQLAESIYTEDLPVEAEVKEHRVVWTEENLPGQRIWGSLTTPEPPKEK